MKLPKQTEYCKCIPKQKFYENADITAKLKRFFVEQIKTIYWQNKLTAKLLNIEAGSNVNEIEVFEIKLNSESINEEVLTKIDKYIPYHILFLLEYDNKYQAWISYKEITDNTVKINKYYHTSWLEKESLPCKLEGLNMDSIYENFVRQIADDELKTTTANTLKEDIAIAEKRKLIEKQINALQNKIRKEKQFNRKVILNDELKKLKKIINKIEVK